MNILALDTATENCSVALLCGERTLALEERSPRGHAARILFMVDELLKQAALTLPQLSAIAFGRGPGSFTGVRLAASVTQGLAFGAGVPVVPVSDLHAVAQRALEEAPPGSERVLICNDARMSEVYWACFERSPQGPVQALTAERVSAPAQVEVPWAWKRTPGAVLGAGSGFAAYPEDLRAVGAALAAIRSDLLPRALEVAQLARPEVAAGRVLAPQEALPVYVRDRVATPP